MIFRFKPGTWVQIKPRGIHPWSLNGRIGQVIKVYADGPDSMVPRYQLKMLDGGEIHDILDYELEAVTAAEVDIEYHRLRMKSPDKIQGIQINATYQDEVMTFEHETLYQEAVMAALRRYNSGKDTDLSAIQRLREFEEKKKGDKEMPGLNHINCRCHEPRPISKSIMEQIKKLPPDPIPEKYCPIRIIYNDPATIIFWQDGTKTVVKRSPNESFNKYSAFCAALAKKMYGCNSRVNKIVDSGITQKEPANDIPDKKSEISEAQKSIFNPWKSVRRKLYSNMKDAERKAAIEQITELKEKRHMSYAKIALAMKLSESTVRNLMKEAKEVKK